MELVFFIVFIGACALLVRWAASKSSKETEAALQRKAQAKKARAELLETPADYTLSRPGQLWFTRKSASALGVTPTNAFALKSQAPEPEYDGHSRRDRHHVADRNAVIQKERTLEEPSRAGADFPTGAVPH